MTAPYDPLSPDDHADADRLLAVARKESPVSCPHPGVNVVATDGLARAVLQDPQTYSSLFNFTLEPGPAPEDTTGAKSVITQTDPPDHAVLRGFLRRWFAPAALRRLEPTVREIVEEVVDALPRTGTVDLVGDLARVIPTRVVYSLIGVPRADWDRVQAWADAANATLPRQNVAVIGELIAYLAGLLQERSASGFRADDIIDGFVQPRPGDPVFDETQAPLHLLQLILAGTDTTSGLIANVFYRILEVRTNWVRLLERPELVGQAVEESLRCDSPIQYVLRTVTEPSAIDGCPMSPRDRVVVSLQSANWDEAAWGETASSYDLDRRDSAANIAFGSGIHACLGAPLARIEARVTLETMLRVHPDLSPAEGFEWKLVPALQMRRPRSLAVNLSPSRGCHHRASTSGTTS
jgi:cytochrome P450